MAVRLQTAKGEIKKYGTTQVKWVTYGESTCVDKYVTKCGWEWKDKPKEREECDHLDCAIYLAKQENDEGKTVFMLFIAGSGIMMILMRPFQDFVLESVILGASILAGTFGLIHGFRAGKRFKELTEYRDHGTINGVKASHFFEDQKVAKARYWWQFWR
jgi:hypothetical protein